MVNEARATAAVRHDNVMRVFDVDVHGGAPVLVLEWVEGVDLGSWTQHAQRAGLFSERTPSGALREFVAYELGVPCSGTLWDRPYYALVASLVAGIARGLQAAHEQGVIHRDVAPKNILVSADGRSRLVDFGVALFYGHASRSQRAGLAGTMVYMAPEQFELDAEANRARRPEVPRDRGACAVADVGRRRHGVVVRARLARAAARRGALVAVRGRLRADALACDARGRPPQRGAASAQHLGVEGRADLRRAEDPAQRNALVAPGDLPPVHTAFEHALTGHVRFRFRDRSGASEALTRAIDADPDRWMYRDLRALTVPDDEPSGPSLADVTIVEEKLGRETSRTLVDRALVTAESEPERALPMYEAALRLGGPRFVAHNNCAEIWIQRAGESYPEVGSEVWAMTEHALRYLREALPLRPDVLALHLILVRCELLRGNIAEARSYVERELMERAGDHSARARVAWFGLNQELIDVLVLQSDAHQFGGESSRSTQAIVAARDVLISVVAQLGEDRPELRAELASLAAGIAFVLDEVDPGTARAAMLRALDDYAHAESRHASPVIATNLGILIAEAWPDEIELARHSLRLGAESEIEATALRARCALDEFERR